MFQISGDVYLQLHRVSWSFFNNTHQATDTLRVHGNKRDTRRSNSLSSTVFAKKNVYMAPHFHGGIFTFLSSKFVKCKHLCKSSVRLLSSFCGSAIAIAVFSFKHSWHFLDPLVYVGAWLLMLHFNLNSFPEFLSFQTWLLKAVANLLLMLFMAVLCS